MKLSFKLFQINIMIKNIFPCKKNICLCIEYLNFKNIKHIEYYKICYNNKKKKNFNKDIKNYLSLNTKCKVDSF